MKLTAVEYPSEVQTQLRWELGVQHANIDKNILPWILITFTKVKLILIVLWWLASGLLPKNKLL